MSEKCPHEIECVNYAVLHEMSLRGNIQNDGCSEKFDK